MARNQNRRVMPGAFSQYRDDEASDSDSSAKSSVSKEAPRGSDSPTKQSTTHIDEDVDALSSRFGKHLHGVSPVLPLLSATATEEPSLGGGSPGPEEPGHMARAGLSAFPSLPDFQGILGRIPVPKPPKEQAAPAPPSSAFSFVASADAFKREFSSTHVALSTSTVDSAQRPVAPPGGPGSAAPEKVPPFWFKSPPGFQRHEFLFDGKNPSIFSDQTQRYLDSVKWQGFEGQKPSLFSDMNKPVSSAENEFKPTGSDSQAETLPGGQSTPLRDGQGHASAKLKVQTSEKPEPPMGVYSPNMAIQENRAASAKHQSDHLQEEEDAVNDEDTPAKRLFRQGKSSNPTMPRMPERYVPEASRAISPIRPIFSSSEDFISFAKKTISLSTSDMEAVMPTLKTLYYLIIDFTKGVATNIRTGESLKSVMADNLPRIQTLSQLSTATKDGVLKHKRELDTLEDQVVAAKSQLRINESLLRSLENYLLEHIIGSIQSVADQAWNSRSLAEYSKRKAEETNTHVNELRLEILALEDKLQKTESRADIAESGEEDFRREVDRLENEHRISLDKMRHDHRAELNNVRSKSGRDKKAALDELKAKYAKQIEDAEGKLRLHKQAMARNDELETTIRDLDRDKYNLGLAKAVVEKELDELKGQVATLKMYEDGYKQIEKERDDFESSYNDMKAERNDLLQAPRALPDTTSSSDSVASGSKVLHSNAGILNSYDEDLGVMEAYWDRQKQFAELAVRETAAELGQMEAQIAEITLQINDLQGIDQSESEEDAEFSEPEDDSDDAAKPAAKHPSSGLLDTLAQPLTAEDGYPALPATRQAFEPTQRQLQTYATKAAAPRASQPGVPGVGRAYAQPSNQGAGVTTVKEICAPESRGWTEVRPRRAK
ncbi:hypothetical protein HBI23_206240 [Parastagonospora nodorum]|nr:hypothetical protein HBI47_129680 [Parastagonospora nodorum]KAH5637944.1 hypothetical protein HBI23_206240 [Parastagonospora nodorum]KAH6202952.1 hypothetical protein HBI43_209950 [Parastagonospora nodorum]KAH6244011.1 hypothetical protein HBI42_210710 [Parastagonospora nodorum]